MASKSRQFKIEVLGDASHAEKALVQLGETSNKQLQSITSMAKKAMGVFASKEIIDGVGSLISAARESEKVNKITEQAIWSTGGAAKLTAQQISELSTALSNKTGIDDEQIQTSQNLLLRYTAIHDEVGKGNQIFSRASAAMLDMSTVMGSSDTAAMKLGKALEDPTKGVTLLAKAGVSFTADQKATIKTMMETGDVLGAQKIILGEVEEKYGGTAEAAGTAADKMKVKWGNFQEEMGTKLLPVVDAFSSWAVNKGIPALEALGRWIGEKVVPKLKEMGDWINVHVMPAFQKIADWINNNWGGIVATFTRYVDSAKTSLDGIVKACQGIIDFVVGVFQGDWSKAWEGLKKVADGAWKFIAGLPAELGKDVFDALKKWGPDVLRGIKEVFENVFIELPIKLSAALIKLGVSIGEEVAKGIGNTISNAVSSAVSYINPFDNGKKKSSDSGMGSGSGTAIGNVISAQVKGAINASTIAEALAIVESKNSNIRTKAAGSSASGYFQILKSTWNGYGGYNEAIDAPRDVQKAKAVQLIQSGLNKYGGDPQLAVASYFVGQKSAAELKAMLAGNTNPTAGTKTANMGTASYVNAVLKGVSGASIGGAFDYGLGGGTASTGFSAKEIKTLEAAADKADKAAKAAQDKADKAKAKDKADAQKTADKAAAAAKTARDKADAAANKSNKNTENTATSTDYAAKALAAMRDSGMTEAEAAGAWRSAMMASQGDSKSAWSDIAGKLGILNDTTEKSITYSGSSEDIFAAAVAEFRAAVEFFSGTGISGSGGNVVVTVGDGSGVVVVGPNNNRDGEDLPGHQTPVTGIGIINDGPAGPIATGPVYGGGSDNGDGTGGTGRIGRGGAYATGGYFRSRPGGYLGVIGEGRESEVLAPEPVLRSIVRQESGSGLTIQIMGNVYSDRDLNRSIIDALRRAGAVRPDGSVVLTR